MPARTFSACQGAPRGVTEGPWLASEAGVDAKRYAPATLRNRDAIATVLADELPSEGLILEVASGSGEHVLHFADCFPALQWQPSDPDPAALTSIAAWSAEVTRGNLSAPIAIDAAQAEWPIGSADAMLCINMVHISPWAATLGLMAGAGRILTHGAPLILYGPFVEAEVPTAPSNLAFDESLRSRDPAWGLRPVDMVAEAAAAQGLALTRRTAMPANNLMLIFRRLA